MLSLSLATAGRNFQRRVRQDADADERQPMRVQMINAAQRSVRPRPRALRQVPAARIELRSPPRAAELAGPPAGLRADRTARQTRRSTILPKRAETMSSVQGSARVAHEAKREGVTEPARVQA